MKAAFVICVLVLAGARARKTSVVEGSRREWFRDAALQTGLKFTHNNGATGKLYMPEIMGSGAALLDFDNDGDLDVFLVQSKGASKFFRNELAPSGIFRFTDITEASGIIYDSYGMGAATGDFDTTGLSTYW